MKSFTLEPGEVKSERLLTLPLWFADDGDTMALRMPGLKTTQANSLSFSFEYAQQYMGGTEDGRCDLVMPPAHQVRIDEGSTIDFTGYRHFIEMPDLKAFAYAGFPFSRMADPPTPRLSCQPDPIPGRSPPCSMPSVPSGPRPGIRRSPCRFWTTGSEARTADRDTLLIGTLPEEFRGDLAPDALLQSTRSWVNEPTRQHKGICCTPWPIASPRPGWA